MMYTNPYMPMGAASPYPGIPVQFCYGKKGMKSYYSAQKKMLKYSRMGYMGAPMMGAPMMGAPMMGAPMMGPPAPYGYPPMM